MALKAVRAPVAVRTDHASYFAFAFAASVIFAVPALASDQQTSVDASNTSGQPVHFGVGRFLPQSGQTNLVTVLGTNSGTITMRETDFVTSAILIGSQAAEATDVLFPAIVYSNVGTLTGALNRLSGQPVMSLGSVGRKGDDGGYHRFKSGGPGQAGQAGGTVNAENHGVITLDATHQLTFIVDDASFSPGGMLITSRGGIGGNGGGSSSIYHAGGGGRGGDAGAITAYNSGQIITGHARGTGIHARSIGGQGGDAGSGHGAAGGRDGGIGGNGGSVTVTNAGSIITRGDLATGIKAESIGGGGGKGGSSGGLHHGGGGDGGKGNTAGDAMVYNTGSVSTAGDYATGIIVDSIGGNGGDGGSQKGLFVAVGGTGGYGGDGSTASARIGGSIITGGALATGLHVLSVGGGGGRGGDAIAGGAWAAVAIGGYAGGGGDGGSVSATLQGAGTRIITTGRDSAGVMVQSIGGGGGAAGSATAVALGVGAAASVAVGGIGGDGGSGGTVTVTANTGAFISTGQASGYAAPAFVCGDACDKPPTLYTVEGSHSYGLLAQSIGGGGGHGGRADSFAFSANVDAPSASVDFSLGGAGGVAGHGGTVTVTNGANITTLAGLADGLVAQSIGGGGGSGGNVLGVAGAASNATSLTAGANLGGKAGGGGWGEEVTVTQSGSIATLGEHSAGVVAQSVGGGGGNGGSVLSVAAAVGVNAINGTANIGGQGGSGGGAGVVTVTQSGTIDTMGSLSHGVLAQSISGGGGNGGSVHNYSVTAAAGSAATNTGGVAINLGVNIGGDGGAGGSGGAVSVTNSGSISTFGALAHGVVVQSIGGGGGNGGSSTSVAVSAALSQPKASGSDAGARQLNAQVNIGGAGGSGNTGGAATYTGTDAAKITTWGDHADGVLVQSVGGGGGSGGHVQATSVTTIVPSSKADVKASAQSSKLGKLFGLLPYTYSQPPAGSGIPGTSLSLNASVGGNGGTGSVGGTVSATLGVLSSISTFGTHSHGVFAQSVGGGGGRGGAANTDAISLMRTSTGSVAIGGNAGAGNHGGSVTVTDDRPFTGLFPPGLISTAGDGANGIFAQSVGGGGGAGGTAADKINGVPTLGGKSLQVEVGGKAAAGGAGGAVSVTRYADISTSGLNAHGIVAQSIGGGGGSAHLAGSGTLMGLLTLSMGGKGGAGASGGAVSVAGNGRITTTGAVSHGVVAQSVGGGGGTATLSNTAFHPPSGQGIPPEVRPSMTFSIGSPDAASQGDGGSVTVTKRGRITTSGNHAMGIVAQSVGGGGGKINAGSLGWSDANTATVTLTAQDTGAGGAVTVDDSSTPNFAGAYGGAIINTAGIGAHGILAQSVGGGGGLVLLDSAMAVPAITRQGHGGISTVAGAITVNSTGFINTTGDFASGILAHSGSGGSLLVATNNGLTISSGSHSARSLVGGVFELPQPGAISITKSGYITTTGRDADAIRVMGDTTAGNGITVNLGADGGQMAVPDTRIVTTGIDSAALSIRNGGTMQSVLFDRATVKVNVRPGAVLDLSGNANRAHVIEIVNDHSLAAVTVAGTLRSGGPDALEPGATGANRRLTGLSTDNAAIFMQSNGSIALLAGSVVDGVVLGNTNTTLTIAGWLRGAVHGIGRYGLSAGGTHVLPVDFQGGRIVANVGTVTSLGGTLAPRLARFGTLPAGQTYSLLSAGNTFAVGPATVQGTLATTYGVATARNMRGGTDLTLQSVRVSFANAPGLDPQFAQGAASADALVTTWSEGGQPAAADVPIYRSLLDAANSNDLGVVQSAVRAVGPSNQATADNGHAASATHATGALLSCGVVRSSFAAISEGDCAWASPTGMKMRSDHHRERATDVGFSIGRQHAVSENWRIGYAVGYEATTSRSIDVRSDGHRLHAGAVVKYTQGPWLAAAAFSAGFGWADATRRLSLSTGQHDAASDRQAITGSSRLRLARLFSFGKLDVTPMLDLDAVLVHNPGYREHGAGVWNTTVRASNSLHVGLHPSLRLGSDVAIGNGTVIRPTLEAGVSLQAVKGRSAMFFHNSEALRGDIRVKHSRDRAALTLGAGLSIFSPQGLEVKVNYSGSFGEATRSHGVALKVGGSF